MIRKIRNTEADMRDPAAQMGLLAEGMVTGSAETFITGQERAGQHELVHSDQLPAECDRDALEALGFTLGNPDSSDPLFIPARFPVGWTREGSDHAMWSYLLDGYGRRRASIFYKAAFYDRRAFMRLDSLETYVRGVVDDGGSFTFDATWATPVTVRAALEAVISREREQIQEFRNVGMAEAVGRHESQAAAYEAALAALGD